MTQVAAKDDTSALQLENAWKMFGHVIALRGVDLTARVGEVMAVVGDNGAGKSTLVKVLAGMYRLDDGRLTVNSEIVHRGDPRKSQQLGVSTVFQDLALIETLDVADNMYLGAPITRFGIFTDKKAMRDGAARTLAELKVRVPSVRIPIGELSGGQRQCVAIARAVLQDNPIIVMDEPTAALGVRETAQVGRIIEELKSRGKAVVLISHDLEFVFAHADWIQVLRLGRVQGVRKVSATNREEIVGLITGLVDLHASTNQTEAR
jgi:simple sugar transport system ATP-binding protein/D-xylose transport system ATP-binding protein